MLRSTALTLAAAFVLAACTDPKPEPVTPVATAAPPPVAPKKKDTATPSSGSVHIDDKIIKACGDLPTAHFAFDSTQVEPDAARALDALARCFSTGPLKGRGVSLVGHADPRGEFDYNMALGQRRAGSVGDYLTSHGVGKGQVAASSRGEIEAVGTDEEGWARDRKVDVLLTK
jgi:peptidoglycan-associated lipoprotein